MIRLDLWASIMKWEGFMRRRKICYQPEKPFEPELPPLLSTMAKTESMEG